MRNREVKIPHDYDMLFKQYGGEVGLDWRLLKAQAWVESRLNPRAISSAGARGLAQFMPATWREWGEGCWAKPENAIKAQARYMSWLISKFLKADWPLGYALAAYNWGIGNMLKLYKKEKEYIKLVKYIPYETWDYVEDVTFIWDRLKTGWYNGKGDMEKDRGEIGQD